MRRFDRSFLEPPAAAGVDYEDVLLAIRRTMLLCYPVHIDPTIGEGPDVFPCPSPRPAGAPDAEQRTRGDAQISSQGQT